MGARDGAEEMLRNPVRRRILEILCSRKSATPKEIAKELKMGVPAVYYHLDLMRGLVTKTSRGEYAATEKGVALYKETVRGEVLATSPVSQLPSLGFVGRIFSLRVLLPAGVAVAAAEFIMCYLYGFRPYFFGYGALAAGGTLPLWLYYVGNIVLLFALLEVASFILTRRAGGEAYLLGGVMVSRLPLMLILIPKALAINFWLTSAVAFAFGPLFSLASLAIFTSLSKGIRIEAALIISFLLLYFDIFIYPLL
jgi:DNA-binding transcriptional ArsR family regulator